MAESTDLLGIAPARIAPVWRDREVTLARILDDSSRAANEGARLVRFGEALLPGYPFWIDLTGGAELGHPRVREEGQNFDPAGHDFRPDVIRLRVKRRRRAP